MSKPNPARLRVFHPLLFAVWPALDLWARNTSEVLTRDVLLACAVLLVGTYALYRLVRLVVRDAEKAGIIASLTVLVFFSYAALHQQAAQLNERLEIRFLAGDFNPLRHRYMILLLAAGLGVASLWIWRTRRSLAVVTRVGNLVAGVLVALVLSRIGFAVLGTAEAEASAPSELANAEAVGEKPDIYYLVLDRYANGETLRTNYGFDNTPFYEDLRERGFVVNPEVRCNYARTTFSFSSALNMEYFGPSVHKANVVNSMMRGHKVGQFLKSKGYRYIHLGSWWTPTAACRLADENITHPAARSSEFPIALLKMTPLTGLPAFSSFEFHIHGETAVFQFEKLQEIARDKQGPKLVVAHILMPHPPFVFDRHGNRIPSGPASTYGKASKHNYLEHLRFTNTKMTEIVDAILAHRTRPTIIVLQGDEGPFLRGEDQTEDRLDQIRIRTGVLSAVYMPDGAEPFATARTPINTFRIILNRYFGANLPLLEERVFAWKGMLRPVEPDAKDLHTFEDVTEQVLN